MRSSTTKAQTSWKTCSSRDVTGSMRRKLKLETKFQRILSLSMIVSTLRLPLHLKKRLLKRQKRKRVERRERRRVTRRLRKLRVRKVRRMMVTTSPRLSKLEPVRLSPSSMSSMMSGRPNGIRRMNLQIKNKSTMKRRQETMSCHLSKTNSRMTLMK